MKRLFCCIISMIILLGSMGNLSVFAGFETELGEIDLVVYAQSKLMISKGEMKELSNIVYKTENGFMLPLEETLNELGYDLTKDSTVVINADSVKIGEKDFKSESKDNVQYFECSVLAELGYKFSTVGNMLAIYRKDIPPSVNLDTVHKMQGIYMSADTNTSGTGTADSPVSNLEMAKKIAEKYIQIYGEQYPVHIFVHGGTYRFDKTVEFSKVYFGKEDRKGVVIKAFGDGEPIFSGASKLDVNGFLPVTDALTLSRLPKAGRGKVAVMDLDKQGIKGLSTSNNSFPYIYVNDEEMPISQWPNSGFEKTKSAPENGVFGYDGQNPSRWTMANDARIWAYFVGDYFYGNAKITKVNMQSGLINYTDGPNFTKGSTGRRWRAVNLLEEIDIPGEWYVDREANKLYFYPPYSLRDAEVEITTLHDASFIRADACNGFKVYGITFTKGGAQAIECQTVTNNMTVNGCKFSYLQGNYAIFQRNYQTLYNLDISENEFYGCAGGAVLAKPGDTVTLQPSNSRITNNHVTACGYYPAYVNAAFMGSENSVSNHNAVETVIENNVIQDCDTVYAMSLTGFDNKFRYNEIINQSKNVDDGGAIYFGFSHHKFGNEIAYNYLHDFNMEHFFCGLYNDDGYSGSYWHNNICYNIPRVSINGTGKFQKNIFNIGINCGAGITAGSRTGGHYLKGARCDTGVETFLNESGGYLKERYPFYYNQIAQIQSHEPYDTPLGSVYYGNIGVGVNIAANNPSVTQYGATEIEYNGETIDITGKNANTEGNLTFDYSDDYFVDPENQNWNIKRDSEIAQAVPQIADYNIEDIGIKSENKNLLQKPDGFALKGPYNGEDGIQTKSVTLSWDRCKNATFYDIMIATDADMTNVVYQNRIRENGTNNFINVENLSNGTVYYWKVKAIGIARQNQFEVESYGDPYMFRTAQKNAIDVESLTLAISSLESFYKTIAESEEYKYDDDFISEVKATLEKANEVKRVSSSQEEIDAMEEEIYFVIRKSPFYMVVHFANIDGIYSNDVEWLIPQSYMQGSVVWADGVLTIKTEVEGSRYEPYTQHIENKNSILVFDVLFEDLLDGGGYQGFDFKMPMKGADMLVVFKESIIEWQPHGSVIELPNPFIEKNKWYRVCVGAINAPNGVLQYLSVDGKVLYAELDQSVNQIREEGRFRIRASGTGAILMKPVPESELPKDKTLIGDILNSFYNPYNEAHLNNMMIGSYDAIEAGTSIYYAVDKKIFSQILFNKLSEEKVEDYDSFKQIFNENLILAAYNSGLTDYVLSNNINLKYMEYLKPQLIDQNGVNIYSFYENRIKDIDKGVINKAMLNCDFEDMDAWRKDFARNIFIRCMNVCNMSFAGTTDYMYELLTKENSEYMGIDISRYLFLSSAEKDKVHQIIRNAKSEARTIDELVEEINLAIDKI